MKPAWPTYGLAVGALAGCAFTPWAAAVAVACVAALVGFAWLEQRTAVREARIAELETGLKALKDTAAALLRVEGRLSAAERALKVMASE